MARKYLDPQQAPEYRSPHVRSDYDRYNQPAAKQINAHPSNKIYAPGTGSGTGRTAVGIGWENRDGTRSPVSGLGAPTGSLSQPMPRMMPSPNAMMATRRANFTRAVADGSAADKINTFNLNNADKYMDAGGNIIPKGGSRGFDVPLDGKGGYAASTADTPKGPAPTSSTAGAAESMRAAAGITGPSSSARGEWQQEQPGTSKIVSGYGTGTSTPRGNASNVASAISSVNSGSGILGKISNGLNAVSDFAKTQPAATFDGKSKESFFTDAAQRQGTQNGYARGDFTTPRPAPQMASGPQPSAVPAENLAKYKQASEFFKTFNPPAPLAKTPGGYTPPSRPPEKLADVNPQSPEKTAANQSVGDAIRSTIPSNQGRVTELNGRPYKSPLAAGMEAPAAKTAQESASPSQPMAANTMPSIPDMPAMPNTGSSTDSPTASISGQGDKEEEKDRKSQS